MDCKIKYNKDGKIERVLTPKGKESSLYKKFASMPFNTKEEALEAYKQTLTNPLGDELTINFQVRGANYSTYKEALLNSYGENISVLADGVEIQTVSSNTNPDTELGLINHAIKADLLSDVKVLQDGDSFFKVEGYDEVNQIVKEQVFKAFANQNSTYAHIFKDGRITLERGDDYKKYRTQTYEEAKEAIGEEKAVITLGYSGIVNSLFKNNTRQTVISESTLIQKATSLLNKAGFKITSLDSYKRDYRIKHGVEPNAQALIDLTNKVVAFAEGQMTAEVVTEEFTHLVLESVPQEGLQDALRNVVSTDEYAEFSEMYRTAYSKEESLTPEEVEEKVRKEILGKIVAKGVKEQLSPKSENIFRYIWNLIRDFFNSLVVTANQQAFSREINALTDSVIDMLISEDASVLDNDFQDLLFYSLNQSPSTANIDEVNQQLKVLLSTLRDQERAFRQGRFSGSKAIEQVLEDLARVETKSSILSTVDFANKQVSFVEKAIQESKNQGITLSPEHTALAISLKTHINDVLVKLGNTIKDDIHLNKLTSDIDSIKLRIVNLDTTPDVNVFKSIVNREIARHHLPSEFQMNGETVNTEQYFLKAIEQVSKDTNTIYAYIGQVSHARDPLLNLLDSVVFDMINRQNHRFYDIAKNFQKELEDLGLTPKDMENFMDKDGYLLSVYDFSKYDEKVLELTTNHFFNFYVAQKNFQGQPVTLTPEDIKNKLKSGEQFNESDRLTEEFKNEYSKVLSNDLGRLRERTYTDSYYQAQNDRLEELNIPKEALDKLRQLGFDRADIMSRVETVDGYPVLRAQEKIDLDAYNTERNLAKALYNSDGELKEGLKILTESQFKLMYGDLYKENKYIYDNIGFVKVGMNFVAIDPNTASVEAKIAYGISKSDANFFEENTGKAKETELPTAFLETLRKIPTVEGQRDFFLTNVNLSVNDSFFTPMADEFEQELENGDSDFEKAYNELSTLQNTRRELLKRYKDSKNATNVLASRMPSSTLDRIKELTKGIVEKRKELYLRMGVKPSEFQLNPEMESTINEDYKGQLRDLGIEENYPARLNFAKKHMTSDSTFGLVSSAMELLKLQNGLSTFMENTLQKSLDTIGVDIADIRNEIRDINNSSKTKFDKDTEVDDMLARYLVELAEKRLAPYYKTIAPNNVSNLMSELQTTENIEGVINELKNAGMDMRVHQSYYDVIEPNPDLNTNHKKGFLAYKVQPKLSLFQNNSFEKRLGVKIKRDSNGQPIIDEYGIPEVETENNLFKGYKSFIRLRALANENTNSIGSDNIYLAPQVSKTNMDKIFTIIQNGKSVKPIAKEFIKELTTFRVDEQEQGETTQDGDSLFVKSGLRIIPKRYFNRLESSEDISSDLFYSTMLMVQESELHKARKEAMTEVTALENAIKEKKFVNGKSAIASNTYKMAKSYIDYNIYGISESVNFRTTLPILGQVDMAKIAKMFHAFVRWKNLAFSWIIPATSWLTAETNILLEQWIGQYLDKDSIQEARKLTAKLFNESAKEFLSIRTKGRLNLLGEYFGVYELEANFENSNRGRLSLLASKVSMGAHSVANFTPVAQSLLSGLVGHRLYGGDFLDKKQFNVAYRLQNPNATQTEINNAWSGLKTKSFYNYLDTDSGKMELALDRLANDLGEVNNEQFKKDMELLATTVGGKVRKFVERIDGNIPQHEKTMLQRNYLGSFLMTHKGWQSIAITNRFKSSHFNLQTGQVEEGSYNTFARRSGMVVDGLIDAMKNKKSLTDFLLTARNIFYKDASDYEKSNIQRVGKDLAFSTAIYVLALMLNGFADDDDNKDNYMMQMTSLLTNRVFNETKSAQVGLIDEIVKTVQDPVVGFDNILKTFQFWNAVNPSDSTAKKYANHSKAFEFWFENLPYLKNTYAMRDASAVAKYRNSYLHFNDPDSYNISSLFLDSKEFKNTFFSEEQ